jgi:hypothetical protein
MTELSRPQQKNALPGRLTYAPASEAFQISPSTKRVKGRSRGWLLLFPTQQMCRRQQSRNILQCLSEAAELS